METITFYSYKGGTGRTLVVANVARYLSRFGKTVAVLDFDLEAPGLHYKLNLDNPGEAISVPSGVVDYFHSCHQQGSAPDSLEDYCIPLELSAAEQGPIHLMGAGDVPSRQYWEKLSQINWHEFLYAPGAVGVLRFLELKERIRERFEPDFLLIDARTGITEIGGVATAILPDKVVCLLLHNRENLDGARAVLRSLGRVKRPPGMAPVEVIPVLARIPALKEQDDETRLVDFVRSFLNEPAEELRDTIAVSDLFTLHSERDLEVDERLRIGGDKSPDQSILLRDYLRLFLRLFKPEIVRPHLAPMIERAKQMAFDHPDRAQKELELLTEYGHPDAYRELLKFYRLRKTEPNIQLRAAQRLWELVRPEVEPILWECIKSNFKERIPRRSRQLPVNLEFIEHVWRQAGGDDVSIACVLAEYWEDSGSSGKAADLLLALVDNVGADPTAAISCMRQLRRAGRLVEIRHIIDEFSGDLGTHPEFLEEVARYAIETADESGVQAPISPEGMAVLRETAPGTTYELLLALGDEEEADAIFDHVIEQLHRRKDLEPLMRVASAFLHRYGRSEFEKQFRARLPNTAFERLQRFVTRFGSGFRRPVAADRE